MNERLALSLKLKLSDADKKRLKHLNQNLEILQSGISERDPDYVDFLRQKYLLNEAEQ